MDELMLLQMEYEDKTPLYKMLYDTRYRVPDYIVRSLGTSEWSSLRHEFVGRLVTKARGTSIDTFYEEVSSAYPYYIDPEIINPEDQLIVLLQFERDYRNLRYRLEELRCQLL